MLSPQSILEGGRMSAISTTSLTGSNLAGLIPANTRSFSSADPASSDASNTATTDSRGAATNVQLSDKVKAILAQANADQSVAERLQAFVQARRGGGDQGPQTDGGSKTDIDSAFQRLSGGDAQAADNSQALGPVEPAINFSNQAQVGGFSVSVTADAKTGAFSTVINGPGGLSFSDERFGRGDEVAGFQGSGSGLTEGAYQAGNVEYITFSQSDAADVSATASSDSSSVAADAAAAYSSSLTVAIDFTTGSIRATQSEVSTASATALVTQGLSPVPIVA
jgi:hypothetical protein